MADPSNRMLVDNSWWPTPMRTFAKGPQARHLQPVSSAPAHNLVVNEQPVVVEIYAA